MHPFLGRRPRGHVRDPLVRPTQLFMGAQTRITTPPASRPPPLVWHPLTTPPVQPLILTDAHRGRSPQTNADPGRNISRSRIHPRPTHPLASTPQLREPPRGGHLWYEARDGLWWLGKVAHRTSTDNYSAYSYIGHFLDYPGPIKINLLPSSYTTSRSAVHGS